MTMADRIAVMDHGVLQQVGTPLEIYNDPDNLFVARFIGSPGMNILDARVEGDCAVVGDTPVPLGARYGTPSGRVQIGIRPEFLTLSGSEGLPVTVTRVEDVGRHRILRADHKGQALNVILPDGAEVPTGQVRLVFDPARTLVYADDWRVSPAGASVERAA